MQISVDSGLATYDYILSTEQVRRLMTSVEDKDVDASFENETKVSCNE